MSDDNIVDTAPPWRPIITRSLIIHFLSDKFVSQRNGRPKLAFTKKLWASSNTKATEDYSRTDVSISSSKTKNMKAQSLSNAKGSIFEHWNWFICVKTLSSFNGYRLMQDLLSWPNQVQNLAPQRPNQVKRPWNNSVPIEGNHPKIIWDEGMLHDPQMLHKWCHHEVIVISTEQVSKPFTSHEDATLQEQHHRSTIQHEITALGWKYCGCSEPQTDVTREIGKSSLTILHWENQENTWPKTCIW